MPIIDGLNSPLFSGTATITSTTGGTVGNTVNGGPLKGLKIRFMLKTASVATAGTAAQTYQGLVMISADSTAWRTAVIGPVHTAGTVVTTFQDDLLVKVSKAEPYFKCGVNAALISGATTPLGIFQFDLMEAYSNEMAG